MAIRIIDLVWRKSTQSETGLLVLLALADNADDETGECHPSTTYLAEKCRTTVRTIQRVISDLEQSGEISVVRRAGRGNTNTYRVNFETLTSLESVVPTRAEREARKGDNMSPFIPGEKVTPVVEKVTPVVLKGDTRVTRNRSESFVESVSDETSPNSTIKNGSAELQKRLRAETKGMSARPKVATIPAEWKPAGAACEYAIRAGLNTTEMIATVLKFVRHHTSKGTRLADFTPAFLTWVDNEVKWKQEREKPELPKPADRKHLVY